MMADFRRRFWVALALTLPILLLSPLIQGVLNLEEALAFDRQRISPSPSPRPFISMAAGPFSRAWSGNPGSTSLA
jgi:hypothetical protein